MDSRRKSPRRRTLKEGKVLLRGCSVLDCLIRDMSDEGARLEFGGPTELPPHFRLFIPSSKTTIPVDLAWQRGLAAGVHFSGPEEAGQRP